MMAKAGPGSPGSDEHWPVDPVNRLSQNFCFETLARSPERLDQIHSIYNELGDEADRVFPEGFAAVWQPIWDAREQIR